MFNNVFSSINGSDSPEEIREQLAAAGITVGDSIVLGDQTGHSGGTYDGDLIINLDR